MAEANTTRTFRPKQCIDCSTSFVPRSGRQAYCLDCTPPQHRRYPTPCTRCGQMAMKYPSNRYKQFCGTECRDSYLREAPRKPKAPAHPKPEYDPRSALRKAVEQGDTGAVFAALRADCMVSETGCWEWQRMHKGGYPYVTWSKRSIQVHRLSLEAKLGKALGKQAAHHMCANPTCVNPDHLQPVTAAQNNAEMMARNYMLSRIRELEAELARLDPTSALLQEVGVALVA